MRKLRVAAATGRKSLTRAMLEGYAAVRVMAEGLRRAGPKVTRETGVAGLASFRDLDLGGLVLSYGPDDRTGLEFVEMSIVGRDGSFLR